MMPAAQVFDGTSDYPVIALAGNGERQYREVMDSSLDAIAAGGWGLTRTKAFDEVHFGKLSRVNPGRNECDNHSCFSAEGQYALICRVGFEIGQGSVGFNLNTDVAKCDERA